MSFSFRSMFQNAGDAGQPGVGAVAGAPGPLESSPAAMPALSSPPLNAAPAFGTSMFKVAAGESTAVSSPFSAASQPTTSAPLTVADVLPQLPPEVARGGALPPEQPVMIASQVLDDALRSGKAAVPLFEVYRVCPALFQTPISPQDPRMVPLPASKLPRLIASSHSGTGGDHAAAASPFAAAQPGASPFSAAPSVASPFAAAPGGSPFGTASETSKVPGMDAAGFSGTPSGLLPPKRQGPPPPLADIPSRDAGGMPSLSLPPAGGPAAPAFPISPFAAAGADAGGSMPASPFAAAAPSQSSPASPFGAAAPAQASPFAAMPALGASPFAAPAPASPPASPFAATAPSGPVAAASGGPSPSPFGTLFGDKAVPTGKPAPDAPAPAPGPLMSISPPGMPAQAPTAAPSAASGSGGPVRVSLASLVKGYTAAELGFDPMVVPAWITTSIPAQTIREWSGMPAPLGQLGVLIDGITDIGFRNVLNTARRDFQVRIEPAVIQSAMEGNAAPPTLPNLASLGVPTSAPAMPSAPAPAAPLGGVMRIEPPAGFGGAPQPTPFAGNQMPAQPEATPPASAPAFMAPFTAGPSPSAGLPTGGPPATPSFGQASPFGAPVAMPANPAPMFVPQAPQAPEQPTFAQQPTFQATAPVSRPLDPFAAPAPVPGAAFGGAPERPAFPSFNPTFGGEAEKASEPTVLPPERSESRPLPIAQPLDGFDSEQLLGKNMPPEAASAMNWSAAAAAAASGSADHELSSERSRPAPVIDVPAVPSGSQFFEPAAEKTPSAPAVRAFVPPKFDDEDSADDFGGGSFRRPEPERRPAPPPSSSRRSPAPAQRGGLGSNVGVQTHDANPDQIMLRALLDTDDELSPQRVVELACGLPGIAACVCLHDGRSISHIGAHKPQAREFQKQATQLAEHLRTLAPLIGIEGAETFTMNSGDRLMTFCFPEGAILGVLHDAEPTLGLRDKITLIARELSRMIA